MNKTALFIVAAAVAAGGIGFTAGRLSHGGRSSSSTAPSTALYQCPMHPGIVQREPGECSICHMPLRRVEEAGSPAAERKPLFYRHPMNPSVTSPVPAKDEMGMDYVPVFDEGPGGATVGGRAPFTLSPERRQLIGVTTAAVEKQDLTVLIRAPGRVAYDPELYAAVSEYREAQRAARGSGSGADEEGRRRAQGLLSSVTLRLRQLGLSPERLEDLGDPASLLLPGAEGWVYAQVSEAEAGLVKRGQSVKVSLPDRPGKEYAGVVASVDAVLDPATRSLRARIRTALPVEAARPETFVRVTILVPQGRRLAVPGSAVVLTGDGAAAFVDMGEGRLEPRALSLGLETEDYREVLSGLAEGERVVTSANFLIDSESRFRAAADAFKRKSADKP